MPVARAAAIIAAGAISFKSRLTRVGVRVTVGDRVTAAVTMPGTVTVHRRVTWRGYDRDLWLDSLA